VAGSYIEILKMDPLVFLTFLEQYKVEVNCDVESAEEMSKAGKQLGQIANSYSFLSSLYTYAGVLKRQLQRNGKQAEYQDMIDKEEALSQTMKAVDLLYRSLSKAITIHIENNRELSYTDGMVANKTQRTSRK
jgi:hypothetical protein